MINDVISIVSSLSTHDLTWRSTSLNGFDNRDYNFQLTTSHGGRQQYVGTLPQYYHFQLTTSHGGRQSILRALFVR